MKEIFVPKFRWSKKEAEMLWKNSEHLDAIIYKDCIHWMEDLPEGIFDLVIADPPFGINFDGKESIYNRDPEYVVGGYTDVSDEDYANFTEEWIAGVARLMKKTASAYIFSGWNHLDHVLWGARMAKLKLVNHCIWKYQFGPCTVNKWTTSHYHVLFLVKDEKSYFFNKQEKYPEDVWEIKRPYTKGKKKNGTKLPDELVCKLIETSSRPGDFVFDPFLGNGTTAVCAKGLYRHYCGYEINEKMEAVHEKNLSETEPGVFIKEKRDIFDYF